LSTVCHRISYYSALRALQSLEDSELRLKAVGLGGGK
jgi:hypothetical protein